MMLCVKCYQKLREHFIKFRVLSMLHKHIIKYNNDYKFYYMLVYDKIFLYLEIDWNLIGVLILMGKSIYFSKFESKYETYKRSLKKLSRKF